jgi:tetratricopeptide (TPR) repeat protein
MSNHDSGLIFRYLWISRMTEIFQSADERSKTPLDRAAAICESYTADWHDGRPDLSSYLGRVPAGERPVLLRNLLEHDVKARRQAGDAPVLTDYLQRLPNDCADVVRRVFLDMSSVSATSVFEPSDDDRAGSPAPPASRLGDYRLVRELGRGGMGAVYEAMHLGRGHRLALKTLPTVSGDSLHRFKREFRVLADVTHPNLVGLRTLECDGNQWFITMDLLAGCDFRTYVRPFGRCDESRLRAALAQLSTGVMALHARGVVHRDLKPGNVMVTAEDRVVVLDFGLVLEANDGHSVAGVAGTPAYMAPEQAGGESVGPAADWYAVGVMLYEGLTGTCPFVGAPLAIMDRKRKQDAPPLDSGAPSDLADLCVRLLARSPAERPDPLAIAGIVAPAAALLSAPSGQAGHELIAREPQLAALDAALAAVRSSGEPVTVWVEGRSGEGKTSLCEAFISPLRDHPQCVVLAGRCYDRESVPFKALDTLIDALTAQLRTLPDADAALLLPDDVGLLAELFPVLLRCDVVARAPKGRLDALDQQQVRQRAFAALRLLLDRIACRTPVICFVDDLQWGDADSASALFEVLRPPAAPAVLLLGSYRSDEADASPFLREWSDRQRQNGVGFGERSVAVGPLSLDEATRLVINIVGRDDEVVRRRAVQFHAQTGGNPFLLTEVAGCFDPVADAFHATDIHGVLAQKLIHLPIAAGPLLEAVSVSGQSIELGEAAAAAGLVESPEEALIKMRGARLLRVVGDKVDTYHDRVRYAVLDRMDDERRRGLHRELAQVIEQPQGAISDAEVNELANGADRAGRPALARVYDLSYHYDAAGDRRRALAYALIAASQARRQFALDVAAQQYAIARRNADENASNVQFRIARGRGEALMQLGRYQEAEPELELAYQSARAPYLLADARGLQGELSFKIGNLEQSEAYISAALNQLGVRVPRTYFGLALEMLKETAIQVKHSCFPRWIRRRPSDRNADLANQLLGKQEYNYYCSNVPYLLSASFVGLNRAQRMPPSPALAFNYVVHANDMAVLGWYSRAVQFYQAAIDLSTQLNDEWGVAHAYNHHSLGCLSAARYEDAIAKAGHATTAFAKLGDVLEYHFSQFNVGLASYSLGDLKTAVDTAKTLLQSSVRHNDNSYAPMSLCLWSRATRGRLPYDEVAGCVQTLPGHHLSMACLQMAEGYWHLHHGRFDQALASFSGAWETSRTNMHVVAYNSWVLTDYVSCLRACVLQQGRVDDRLVRRWRRMAVWADRLSWLLPPERPRAVRELSLVHEHLGNRRKAWSLATKSCRVAEGQKAQYEYAQSLLVCGRLGFQLGRPEAANQIAQAEAEIARIEAGIAG